MGNSFSCCTTVNGSQVSRNKIAPVPYERKVQNDPPSVKVAPVEKKVETVVKDPVKPKVVEAWVTEKVIKKEVLQPVGEPEVKDEGMLPVEEREGVILTPVTSFVNEVIQNSVHQVASSQRPLSNTRMADQGATLASANQAEGVILTPVTSFVNEVIQNSVHQVASSKRPLSNTKVGDEGAALSAADKNKEVILTPVTSFVNEVIQNSVYQIASSMQPSSNTMVEDPEKTLAASDKGQKVILTPVTSFVNDVIKNAARHVSSQALANSATKMRTPSPVESIALPGCTEPICSSAGSSIHSVSPCPYDDGIELMVIPVPSNGRMGSASKMAADAEVSDDNRKHDVCVVEKEGPPEPVVEDTVEDEDEKFKKEIVQAIIEIEENTVDVEVSKDIQALISGTCSANEGDTILKDPVVDKEEEPSPCQDEANTDPDPCNGAAGTEVEVQSNAVDSGCNEGEGCQTTADVMVEEETSAPSQSDQIFVGGEEGTPSEIAESSGTDKYAIEGQGVSDGIDEHGPLGKTENTPVTSADAKELLQGETVSKDESNERFEEKKDGESFAETVDANSTLTDVSPSLEEEGVGKGFSGGEGAEKDHAKLPVGALQNTEGMQGAIAKDTGGEDEVIANEVVANEVVASKVVANEVVANDVVANDVVANEVVANEVVANEVIANEVVANEVVANEVVANEVVANEVVANEVVANEVVANEVVANDVVANEVVANEVVTSEVVTDEVVAKEVIANDVGAKEVVTDEVVAKEVIANEVVAKEVIANEVVAKEVGAKEVVANEVGANEVVTNEVVAKEVISNEAVANEVVANEVVANEVVANEVVAKEVIANEVVANEMGANEVVANEVVANEMIANEVVANEVVANEVVANEVVANDVVVSDVVDNKVVASEGVANSEDSKEVPAGTSEDTKGKQGVIGRNTEELSTTEAEEVTDARVIDTTSALDERSDGKDGVVFDNNDTKDVVADVVDHADVINDGSVESGQVNDYSKEKDVQDVQDRVEVTATNGTDETSVNDGAAVTEMDANASEGSKDPVEGKDHQVKEQPVTAVSDQKEDGKGTSSNEEEQEREKATVLEDQESAEDQQKVSDPAHTHTSGAPVGISDTEVEREETGLNEGLLQSEVPSDQSTEEKIDSATATSGAKESKGSPREDLSDVNEPTTDIVETPDKGTRDNNEGTGDPRAKETLAGNGPGEAADTKENIAETETIGNDISPEKPSVSVAALNKNPAVEDQVTVQAETKTMDSNPNKVALTTDEKGAIEGNINCTDTMSENQNAEDKKIEDSARQGRIQSPNPTDANNDPKVSMGRDDEKVGPKEEPKAIRTNLQDPVDLAGTIVDKDQIPAAAVNEPADQAIIENVMLKDAGYHSNSEIPLKEELENVVTTEANAIGKEDDTNASPTAQPKIEHLFKDCCMTIAGNAVTKAKGIDADDLQVESYQSVACHASRHHGDSKVAIPQQSEIQDGHGGEGGGGGVNFH